MAVRVWLCGNESAPSSRHQRLHPVGDELHRKRGWDRASSSRVRIERPVPPGKPLALRLLLPVKPDMD